MADEKKLKEHLKAHQEYPATKEDLLLTCGELSDIAEADKKEFMEKLPEGEYRSADEVFVALGM